MNDLIKKIDDMLETIYNQEKSFIDDLDFDEDFQSIQDISIDEIVEAGYGWEILRDLEYIEEKKSILEKIKKTGYYSAK